MKQDEQLNRVKGKEQNAEKQENIVRKIKT